MSRAVAGPAEVTRSEDSAATHGYFSRSASPLVSLVFLLPLVAYYEVGTRYLTSAAHRGWDQQIIAFTLIQQFFHMFGASGRHLPALAVGGILLACHIARNDRWQVDLNTIIGMALESALLAFPLIALSFVLSRYFPLAAGLSQTNDAIIMSMGAGIYEELVFRLALFSLLSLLLTDGLRVPPGRAHLLVVVVSAILFSSYHYLSPTEHFQWRAFAFRGLAGIYFGALFLTRGFGITAGCHAAYDIIIMFF